MRASFASDPSLTRGRRVHEDESNFRSSFQRDRDRIIHSSAFRRLKHKTQVFVEHEGDYYRTRLTHSIEVAQVARTIAGALGLNVELTEAVTSLERHYAEFDGLNLTWETLEGIAKHNGPVLGALPHALADYNAAHDLELHTHASAEAQVAALADDIAYNNHDLHDGLRAGLFTEGDIAELPLLQPAFAQVDALYPGLDAYRRRHEALRRVFGMMVADVIETSRGLLAGAGAKTAQGIRELGRPVIRFSPDMWRDLGAIRKFLFTRMYRAPAVMVIRADVTRVVEELFPLFLENPALMPADWANSIAQAAADRTMLARIVADYIAGMTDRFALQEHERLIGDTPRAGVHVAQRG